jgi:putative hemin transport protein
MPLDEPVSPQSADLLLRWQALRKSTPAIRNRDAAEALGVSEAQLIASGLGEKTIRLQPDWHGLFARLPALGRVMALTRNENVVHERRGAYGEASFHDHVGLVLGEDIDLRIFLKTWRFIFAVEEEGRRGTMRSLQIFDRTGTAVHKIYAEAETSLAAWRSLLAELRAPEQSADLEIAAPAEKAPPRADAEIDASALLQGWAALKDTHDFQPLLNKHKVQPTQAFRLAEGRFTARLGREAVQAVLTRASVQQVPIMVFVGNPGIIQIHSGTVSRIQTVGEWLNVLDPEFNLHLREDRIGEVWRVEKPTTDGIVTSVEVFDADGTRMVTFFGKRKPGSAELSEWRALVAALSAEHGAAA